MKKRLKVIRLAVLTLLAIVCAVPSASAQKGEMTVGLDGGYASYNKGGYVKAFMHYTIVPHVRLAPELGFAFRNEGRSAFLLDFDVQFPFRLTRGLNIYPLAGVTFNNWSYEGAGHDSRVGLDFGGGFDIYLTRQLKFMIQGKYSLMNDTGGGFVGLGIGYNF